MQVTHKAFRAHNNTVIDPHIMTNCHKAAGILLNQENNDKRCWCFIKVNTAAMHQLMHICLRTQWTIVEHCVRTYQKHSQNKCNTAVHSLCSIIWLPRTADSEEIHAMTDTETEVWAKAQFQTS